MDFGLFFISMPFALKGQEIPKYYDNPVLSGFNPDPSICRVNDDYYMVTSSFIWYPGIPIYHSKDLVNWEVIGHAIDRPDMIDMNGLNDNDGIWAVTIRYHNGIFYLITTAHKNGEHFYITATDPKEPWSAPVWLKIQQELILPYSGMMMADVTIQVISGISKNHDLHNVLYGCRN